MLKPYVNKAKSVEPAVNMSSVVTVSPLFLKVESEGDGLILKFSKI